jgi:flagellar biosynthesis protein FliQ
MSTELEGRSPHHVSIVRKAFAGAILVVAAALILKLVIGFVIAIFWTVVAVAAVVAIIWALKTILW